MKMLLRYGNWLRDCRAVTIWAISLAGIAAIAEGLAMAALIPLLNVISGDGGHYLDTFFTHMSWQPKGAALVLLWLTLFFLLATVATTTRAFAEVLGLKIKAHVENTMRERMTNALLCMEWPSFIKLRLGDLSKAMVLEGMQVGTGAMYVVSALGSALAASGYLIISILVSVDLTLVSLTFGVFSGGMYILATRCVRRYADRLSHLVGDIGDRSAELFGNLKYFRATGQELELRQRAISLFDSYTRVWIRSQIYSPLLRGGIEILAALFIAVFFYFHLEYKQGSVAEIVVFLGIFYRMVPRLLSAQNGLFQARTYTTWMDTYDARQNAANAAARPVEDWVLDAKFQQLVRFRGVGLTFPDQKYPVLININLEIRKGQCIALVGPSGGGKTTLTDMLIGLIRPTMGSVEVDGVDLNQINQSQWRSHIGLVMQESLMLHDTVANNVAMCPEAKVDRARVEKALKAADAWEFVMQLSQGIDTLVAERGARLSGGQRQRIAIARALYRSPSILILDEATSALDSYAEENIQHVIERMGDDVTTLIIAHRLKTVKNADLICVIEGGEIKEVGTWGDLMRQRGMLYEMAIRQDMSSTEEI